MAQRTNHLILVVIWITAGLFEVFTKENAVKKSCTCRPPTKRGHYAPVETGPITDLTESNLALPNANVYFNMNACERIILCEAVNLIITVFNSLSVRYFLSTAFDLDNV